MLRFVVLRRSLLLLIVSILRVVAVGLAASIAMTALTANQSAVLDFLREYQAKHGYPPSTREIQLRFGWASQTAAMNHLKALQHKGLIERKQGAARAITILAAQAA